MLGFLVFHKILDRSDQDRFSIDREEFRRILRVARTHGRIIAPGEMLLLSADPSLMLTFDDGTMDHYDVLGCEQEAKGVFFINTASIGARGYLGRQHIRDMLSAGHSIGSHSHKHVLLTKIPQKEMRDDVERSVKLLEDLTGSSIAWFAPPEGVYDEYVRETAERAGIRYFRTTDFGGNTHYNSGGMRLLNTFNVSRRFLSDQLEQCLTSKASYLRFYTAYRTKNYIKSNLPGIYRVIRQALDK